jgi:hypothetical protein
MALEFDWARLPDGRPLAVRTRLAQVAQVFKVDPSAKYRQQRFSTGVAFTF